MYTEKNTVFAKAIASTDIEGELDNKRWSEWSTRLRLVVPKNDVKPVFNNLNYFLKNLLSNDNIITFIRLLEKNHHQLIFN